MTTLAYKHKDNQIAIDSRITSNGTIRTDEYDKTITNDIGTWFFTGSCCDQLDLSKLRHNDHVDVIPDVTALLVHEGDVYLVLVNSGGYCEWFKIDHDCAYGSGGDFALASMDHGKTALEAVEYACTRDIYSGGELRVFNTVEGKFYIDGIINLDKND